MSYILRQVKQLEILRMLSEGNSISSTSRLTGVHRDTCTSLMLRFGEACQRFLDVEMRDLQLGHVEIDELWTFCRKKDKQVIGIESDIGEIGSFFIFVALDQETRLIPAFRIDKRTLEATTNFMVDLARRLKWPRAKPFDAQPYVATEHKPLIRISTDAFISYPEAIDTAFGPYVEYAQIQKDVSKEGLTITKRVIKGKIDSKQVTTSLVERSNLTMRTFMRRIMRRTLGFSKKLANLRAAAASYYVMYNYCWRIKTLKTTPAIKAGIAKDQFTIAQLYDRFREQWPELFWE